MDTCLDLIALQYTCMIVMAMLAFFVFVSRYYVTCRNRQFEQSRWMIVVALLLFVVHYMCQMRLGWRQQGNDVGVLFNLLFYSPSAILLSWSQLNILRAGAGFSLGAFDLCTYKKQKESDIGAYTIKQTTDYYKTILRA